MARVKVVFLQEFYRLAGRSSVELEVGGEAPTVRSLIELIDSTLIPGFKERVLDERGGLKHPVEVTVNGRRIDFLNGLETILENGDRVAFSPRALFTL